MGARARARRPPSPPMSAQVDLSVVVPVFNEQESLPVLHAEIAEVMLQMGVTWEVIYVDDASTDDSLRVILDLRKQDPHVRAVKFRRNYGQTAGLSAGFEHSRGEVVVTLDGDLQNDPADIPALLAEIENGHDIVAGWRKKRHDGFILRRLPSIIANRLIAFVTGVPIHDTGCTLKAFKRELVKKMPIYAEQHRFLPVMSHGSGARVTEIVVNHRPRLFGHSKYGIARAFRVLLDLLTVKLLSQFTQRPLHYFGLLSLGSFALVVLTVVVALSDRTVEKKADLGLPITNEPVELPIVKEPVELPVPKDPTELVASKTTGELAIPNDQIMVVALITTLFLCVLHFALLGLLAELTVKASGMHRRGTLSRILNELN